MNKTICNYATILGLMLLNACVGVSCKDDTSLYSADVLDVFPESTVEFPAGKQGQTILSAEYTPTDSTWGEGLKEDVVFLYEMKHKQDKDNSYNLRIGKGGQLYSLRGPFGESIPPQGKGNPWNDEVWQFVSVCPKYNGLNTKNLSKKTHENIKNSPYGRSYFIHNSGAYIPCSVDSGRITFSCDVMLNKEKPGTIGIFFRDDKRNRAKFINLDLSPGGISVNGRKVASAKPGEWYTIEVGFTLDDKVKKNADITVKNANMADAKATVPFSAENIGRLSLIGFSSPSKKEGIVNIDNFNVKRVTDTLTEWPVKQDYEDYVLLDVHGPAKNVFVTDKVAAKGKKSLEIHDGPEMAHSWQPMVRNSISTTVFKSLYCPLLGADIPADGRTYRTVNWGFVPQLKTVHRSPILYYVQTRDLGDGVIEITYAVHNFSVRDDITFDWLNAPWGGTRITSLPFIYMGMPDGKLKGREWLKKNNVLGVRKTGGWNISCATEDADSPSLALVFGCDKNLEAEKEKAKKGLPHCQKSESIYRYIATGLPADWKIRPDNTFRNYDVAVVIPKFNLSPGKTIWYRSYLVINRKDRTVELAKSLVDNVDYGYLTFDPAKTSKIPVYINKAKVVNTGRKPAFELFSKPVPGTMPLFLIENKATGQEIISSDLYSFVKQEKLDYKLPAAHKQADYYKEALGYSLDENNSKWKRLLGYAYKEKPKTGNWVQLSSLLPSTMFPKASRYHLNLWIPGK